MVLNRRDTILRAAAECIAAEGLDGTSLKRIAEKADVSASLILYHFKNKKALALEAWAFTLKSLRERQAELGVRGPSLRRLEALYEAFWLGAEGAMPPPSFWLEYWAQASRDEELRRRHLGRFEENHLLRLDDIHAEQEAGRFRSDIDADLIADVLIALVWGFEIQISLDRESMPPERAYRAVKEILRILGANPPATAAF